MNPDEMITARLHADLAFAALLRAGAVDLDLPSASAASELLDAINSDIDSDAFAV